MGRGFLGGAIWGTVVSVCVAGAASLLVGHSGDTRPEATSVEVPAGSQFDQSREDSEAVLPDAQSGPAAGDAPRVTAPLPDTIATGDIADTDTATPPQTDQPAAAMTAPDVGRDGSVSVTGDAPVLPNPQGLAPQVPEADSELSISTDPAQPVAPQADEGEGAAFGQDEAAVVDEPQGEAEPEEAPQAEAAPGPEPMDKPVVMVPEAKPDAPMIGKPAGNLKDLAPEVAVNRLPSLAETPESAEQDTQLVLDRSALPPIERYAEPFDNKDEKPVMAIVLIDDGQGEIGVEALASFPYPISFAVDAGMAGAEDAMAKYRARGFEVLALARLPEGASAGDTEVALAVQMNAVPEAVAVMEDSPGGLQGSREISDQVAAIMKASGHGLLLFPKGLDTARKLAVKEGVPAATVFREFDNKGQDAAAMKRFLDQAAVRAAQEAQGVIMVGHLRAETVSGLVLWGLQDRANRVALAPVSAILQVQQN